MKMKKFGTFSGVFVPSFEAILGTVLFLLLPILTAEVGLFWMLVVIVLAHTVTLSAACSLSDCVTNLNRVGGGGLYVICKESLGKALGGAIGFSLFLAQVASVGFYIIGFTEVLYPLLASFMEHLLMETWGAGFEKQIMASGFLLVFCIVALVGANFVVKLQNLIFIILSVSVLAIFVASFTGMKFEGTYVFQPMPNLLGRTSMTFPLFFVIFTQFFPAVTGISAGVGMSGNLKTPQQSMVRGTFTAILVTFAIYIAVTVTLSFINYNVLLTDSSRGLLNGRLLTELFGWSAGFPYNIAALLVFMGILFATASSSLSLFVAAPRTLQSIIWDKLLPKSLRFLSRDFFKRKSEPRFAIVLTFLMSLGIIWAGNLSFAATLVGILFLLVYAWVNGAAFLERMSKNPTFRPTFKGHWVVSLYGLLASLVVISLFNWVLGILLIVSQFVIFRLLLKYKTGGKIEGVWWSIMFNLMNYGLRRLKSIAQSPKNWRPIMQVIALETPEQTWKRTAEIAVQMGKFSGFAKFALIQKEYKEDTSVREEYDEIYLQRYSYTKNPAEVGLDVMKYVEHILDWNTTLIEYHPDFDLVNMLRMSLEMERDTILFRPAAKKQAVQKDNPEQGSIDIWWLNEDNGNFMLMLSYIINKYREMEKQEDALPIRILRALRKNDSEEQEKAIIQEHLMKSRLEGYVEIIPYQENKILSDYLSEYSFAVPYVFTGLPGEFMENETGKFSFFNFIMEDIDEYFFDKMIQKFSPDVSIFFVKSKHVFHLFE